MDASYRVITFASETAAVAWFASNPLALPIGRVSLPAPQVGVRSYLVKDCASAAECGALAAQQQIAERQARLSYRRHATARWLTRTGPRRAPRGDDVL